MLQEDGPSSPALRESAETGLARCASSVERTAPAVPTLHESEVVLPVCIVHRENGTSSPTLEESAETVLASSVERTAPAARDAARISKNGARIVRQENGKVQKKPEETALAPPRDRVAARRYEADWPVLIVCPASLRYTWAHEIEKWLPTLAPSEVSVAKGRGDREAVARRGVRFVIVTYSLFTESSAVAGAVAARKFGCVVVDEYRAARNFLGDGGLVGVAATPRGDTWSISSEIAPRNEVVSWGDGSRRGTRWSRGGRVAPQNEVWGRGRSDAAGRRVDIPRIASSNIRGRLAGRTTSGRATRSGRSCSYQS